jgi:hypothetical protein
VFLAGAALLVFVVVVSVLAGIRLLRSVDWVECEPTSLVLLNLRWGSSASIDAGWMELVRRDQRGLLSPNQRDKMVQFALAQQATPLSRDLERDTVLNYLADRFLSGSLPPQQSQRFVQQAVRLKLAVRPTIIAGDPLPILVTVDQKYSDWLGIISFPQVKVSVQTAIVDGQNSRNVGVTGDIGYLSAYLTADLPSPRMAGKHQIKVLVRTQVFTGLAILNPSDLKLVYQDDRTLDGLFDVIPTAPPGFIHPISDPNLVAAMTSAVSTYNFGVRTNDNFLQGQIALRTPPANLSCDVLVRYGGKEYPVAVITYSTQRDVPAIDVSATLPQPVPDKIDVILRPNEKATRNTVDLFRAERLLP